MAVVDAGADVNAINPETKTGVLAQAVTGVEESEIVEVIDHHRLAGDLVSREPIRFLNEPVGSTSTLVARKFRHRYLEPDKGTALTMTLPRALSAA